MSGALLRLTGDPKWADELELSLYNSLLGVMTPDGNWWGYFAYLNGERIPCSIQHPKAQMTCCVASGPRGLLLTPQWAVMKSKDGIVVNLYARGSAHVQLDGGVDVTVVQETSYPEAVAVNIAVTPGKPTKFKLRLRIPSWSKLTQASINGQAVSCEPGRYAELDRIWTSGDQVRLVFDMRGRAIQAPSCAPELALARGPILLALDSRLATIDNRAVYIEVNEDGYVPIIPTLSPSTDVWMAFAVPVYTRRGPASGRQRYTQMFCDYASAGNEFLTTNPFRTWLPQPLDLASAYYPDIWKLAYGNVRPPMPTFEQVGP